MSEQSVIVPQNLRMHEATSETLQSVSFADFMDSHGRLAIDFQQVWKDFDSLCPSIVAEARDGQSFGLGFANKVVYEISNEVRAIKPKGRDRSWNLIIPAEGERAEATLNVASYKNVDAAHSYSYKCENRRLYLSIRLANMISVEIICKNMEKFSEVTLTPLGGAVYSSKDLVAIGTALKLTKTEVACVINRSTVGTPFQLPGSDFACAVAAVMTTTRKMKNQEDARKIINKVIKGYIKLDKAMDYPALAVWGQYATGGIPEEYSVENLQKYIQRVRPAVSLN